MRLCPNWTALLWEGSSPGALWELGSARRMETAGLPGSKNRLRQHRRGACGTFAQQSWAPTVAIGATHRPLWEPRLPAKRLHQPRQPAVGVLGAAILQVEQLGAQALGHGVAALLLEADGALHGDLLAHQGDHRGGAAGEYLVQLAGGGGLAPLVDADRALLVGQPLVPGQGQHRVPGPPLEDGVGEARGGDAAILEDEEEVHAAQLLDPLVLGGVEEGHLAPAVVAGLLLGGLGGSIVAAALGETGTARGGALVVAGEPDGDRLHAALEVGRRR